MQPRLLDDEVTFDAPQGADGRVLVVACGAIAREVLAVIRLNGWTHVTLQCLPGKLHNTPGEIAAKVDAKLTEAEASGVYDAMFVAYGDCGTAGALDVVCAAHGVERLPGDHCYGLKIDTHPELLPMYFGNYQRLVYLSQTDDPALVAQGRAAAAFLGLDFEHRPSGYGDLQPSLETFVGAARG